MAYLEAEKSKRTFKLNRNATAVIETEMTGDVYKHKISITIEQASMKPLQFTNKDEIAKLLQEADLEDEQTNLFPESESLVDSDPAAYKRKTGKK
jgi:hypothetical protein